MFDMLLKALGLTPQQVQEYSDLVLNGVKSLNAKIDSLLELSTISAQETKSRLAALEEKMERLLSTHEKDNTK